MHLRHPLVCVVRATALVIVTLAICLMSHHEWRGKYVRTGEDLDAVDHLNSSKNRYPPRVERLFELLPRIPVDAEPHEVKRFLGLPKSPDRGTYRGGYYSESWLIGQDYQITLSFMADDEEGPPRFHFQSACIWVRTEPGSLRFAPLYPVRERTHMVGKPMPEVVAPVGGPGL